MADWQVGDMALCVVGGDEVTGCVTGITQTAPLQGRIFKIDRVRIFDGILGLGCASDWIGFLCADRFRKVTPPAADEFDRETIALMNRVEQPA